MRLRRTLTLIAAPICLLLSGPPPAEAQFSQQGPKLVGAGAQGPFPQQGFRVALSADGNTALIGGPGDTLSTGAVWVWTRTGGVWAQQGSKLVGTGINPVLSSRQGFSVSLSADGNTALVGALDDNSGAGAAWVWTRSGGVWTQQGPRLVGAGAVGAGARQGFSVALSGDGNTALVGGPTDGNFPQGAVWVWTRSAGVWTQQGPKLFGAGAEGGGTQGRSVSLSADGNTALVGSPDDNSFRGAVWVWTRTGGVWTQQGSKLVGSGAAGAAGHGASVSLSADGNTALIGGNRDNAFAGATWVWTRSGGVWTQQGPKLVGSGAGGAAVSQGGSVSLSADGNVALIGGSGDAPENAAWVWTRSGGVWTQKGSKLVGSGAAGVVDQGVSVSLSANGNTVLVGVPGDNNSLGATWVFAASTRRRDFDWDGRSDLVLEHTDGSSALWLMDGLSLASGGGLLGPATGWRVIQTADFDGDRRKDLVLQHANGSATLWLMNGLTLTAGGGLLGPGTGWRVTHTGDFNGDFKSDLVLQHTDGSSALWLMDGLSLASGGGFFGPGTGWSVATVDDFNADGKSDLVWQHTDGSSALWLMNGVMATSGGGLLGAGTGWSVIRTGDFNGDDKGDLVWRHTNGGVFLWLMNGLSVTSTGGLLGPATGWSVQQVGDFNGDSKSDLVWQHTDGSSALWLMNGVAPTSGGGLLGAGTGWSVIQTGDFDGDSKSDLVWQHLNGSTLLWLMNGLTPTTGGALFGAGTGWSPVP